MVREITGEAITFDSVIERTTEEQGAKIIPSKVMQRADKGEQYGEFNDYFVPVATTYDRNVGNGITQQPRTPVSFGSPGCLLPS